MELINREKWLLCPICRNKTRIKLRQETTLTHFPLFCPKCKQETLVDVREYNVSVIRAPESSAS